MGLGHSPSIIRDGLVLYLDAANPKSYPVTGTTWTALGNTVANGILLNGVSFDNESGGALVFDGVNDFVDTGKTASQLGIFDTSYTMSAFFKVPNLSGDKMVFGTTGSTTRQGMHHGVRNGTFYFGHFSADTSASGVLANTWYHGTWVWTSTAPNARIYINGVLVGSANVGSFIGTTNILIGKWLNLSPLTIAQASVYNRALTVEEIKQNFNALRGRFGV